MSGRAKRNLYFLCFVLLYIGAFVGAVFMFLREYFAQEAWDGRLTYGSLFLIAVWLDCFFPLSVIVHELGHLLFGLLVGFRPIRISVNGFHFGRGGFSYRFQRFAGKTEALPKRSARLRGRYGLFALGGAILNFIYGGVFLALYFLVPVTPALFFFEASAPFSLCQGMVELIPCELSEGRTDGKLLCELFRNTPYAQVFLAVISAQGLLMGHTFSEIPRESLFGLPAVREDDRAFLALTQLRWQYLFFTGDEAGAASQLSRLQAIGEDCELPAELVCDIAYGKRVFSGEAVKEPEYGRGLSALRTRYALTGEGKEEALACARREKFVGVRALEEKLISRAEEQK